MEQQNKGVDHLTNVNQLINKLYDNVFKSATQYH